MSLDYVLVKSRKEDLLDIARRLSRLDQVRELHPLFGEWDFILKVAAEPHIDGADALNQIRQVPGILATKWLGVSRKDDTRAATRIRWQQAHGRGEHSPTPLSAR